MSTSSRIPPLLQPYTRFPKDDSILLLTSTLGASANWLIIRFLCEALHRDPASRSTEDGNEDVAVILVSWMRDWDFWRSEARKGGGLDLERLKREKRLAFVDGLSSMFLQEASDEKPQTVPGAVSSSTVPNRPMGAPVARTPQTVLPARGPPGRVNPRAPTTVPAPPVTNAASSASTHPVGTPTPGNYSLTSPALKELRHTVENAIRHVESTSQKKPILILDTPSFVLASDPSITPFDLSSAILHLHTLTSHILVHLPADDALLSLSTPSQPLEIDGHNFLVKTAHMSSRILSCRVLDTGFAKDVSGVLRVTENNTGLELQLPKDTDAHAEERPGSELLYLVKGDGSVKMFERGAGGDV